MLNKPNKIKHRWKQVAAALLTAAVIGQPVYSSGIPTIDAAAIAQMVQQALVEGQRWAEQYSHYQQVASNWQTNLRNLIRNKISELTGVDLNTIGKSSNATLIALAEKQRRRCTRISNTDSQTYCNKMIDLEVRKITLFTESSQQIKSRFNEVNRLVVKQNQLASRGDTSGQVQSVETEIVAKLQNIQNLMNRYDLELKHIETEIGFYRDARIRISQDQMKGSDAVVKAAASAYLQNRADSVRNEAERLRNRSNNRSNSAFGKMQ